MQKLFTTLVVALSLDCCSCLAAGPPDPQNLADHTPTVSQYLATSLSLCEIAPRFR